MTDLAVAVSVVACGMWLMWRSAQSEPPSGGGGLMS